MSKSPLHDYDGDYSNLRTLPAGWEWSTLADITENHDGTRVPIKADDRAKRSGPYPYYGASGIIDDIDDYIFDGEYLLIAEDGANLLSRSTPVAFKAKGKFWVNNHAHVVKTREPIPLGYLEHYIEATNLQFFCTGSAQPKLNQKNLNRIPVPIAPPEEQKRIVAKIEELFSDLDAGVSALERARANLRRYRASVLKSAVEGRLTKKWRVEAASRRLEEQKSPDKTRRDAASTYEPASELLARILRERRQRWEQQQLATYESKGKNPPKKLAKQTQRTRRPDTANLPELPEGWVWATPAQLAAHEDYSLAIGPFGSNLKVSDYTETGVPLVFVRNIRSGQFGDDGKKAKYVSPEKADELFAHSVDGGDILITKMGEPPGDATLYPKSEPHAIITADCIKFRPSPLAGDPNYFVWAINSQPVHNQILKITRGVAQKKVSLGRFATIAFPLPPVQEQEELLRHLENAEDVVNKIEETFQRSENRSERLRQSILKRAFDGSLLDHSAAQVRKELNACST